MDAQLRWELAFGSDDVRPFNTLSAPQLGGEPAYAAIGLIADFREEKRNVEPNLIFHCRFPLPVGPRFGKLRPEAGPVC